MSTLKVDTITDTSGGKNPTLVSGTAQATTSGTSVTFTGIPAWVTKVHVNFHEVSSNGTDNWLVRIGDSGGIEATGYTSSGAILADSASVSCSNSVTGFFVRAGGAARITTGTLTISMVDTNDWVASGSFKMDTSTCSVTGGGKTLSDTLTQVQILGDAAGTFDGGQINIQYE